ncbi:MAG: sortase [Actinomycetota bacterium]
MILRVVGRTFIATGILILCFLGYQLFGTTLITDQHQKTLAADLKVTAAEPLPTKELPPELGEGIALIEIPKIAVKKIVVEGVEVEDLKKGPGRYPGLSFPGEKGNVVISGHRTTYGGPFYRLDELTVGDDIKLTDRAGTTFTYRVTETKIVRPNDLTVVVQTTESKLTLTTCNPRFSARQRLIVVADLQGAVP